MLEDLSFKTPWNPGLIKDLTEKAHLLNFKYLLMLTLARGSLSIHDWIMPKHNMLLPLCTAFPAGGNVPVDTLLLF